MAFGEAVTGQVIDFFAGLEPATMVLPKAGGAAFPISAIYRREQLDIDVQGSVTVNMGMPSFRVPAKRYTIVRQDRITHDGVTYSVTDVVDDGVGQVTLMVEKIDGP